MICGGSYHWACGLYDLGSEVSGGGCDISSEMSGGQCLSLFLCDQTKMELSLWSLSVDKSCLF